MRTRNNKNIDQVVANMYNMKGIGLEDRKYGLSLVWALPSDLSAGLVKQAQEISDRLPAGSYIVQEKNLHLTLVSIRQVSPDYDKTDAEQIITSIKNYLASQNVNTEYSITLRGAVIGSSGIYVDIRDESGLNSLCEGIHIAIGNNGEYKDLDRNRTVTILRYNITGDNESELKSSLRSLYDSPDIDTDLNSSQAVEKLKLVVLDKTAQHTFRVISEFNLAER